MSTDSARPASGGWHHRYAVLVACATFLLIIAGGLVTSTGSGLAVPDWPLSFGQVFPRMEGGVLYEHGHRLIASAIGLLTVILAIWTARAEPRRGVRLLGWAMLAAVIVQGVLGGITVLLRLPDAVSVAHAGLAQLFFAATVVMATVTSQAFATGREGRDVGEGREGQAAIATSTIRLAIATALAIYVQILLGAVVRHTGAGLIIPDFPLSYGRLIPPFPNSLVVWQFAHRVGALVATLLVFVLALRLLRRHADTPWVARGGAGLMVLVCWQVFLGALTIWKQKAVTPTTAHVASGALLFAMAVVVVVRCWRVLRPAPAT